MNIIQSIVENKIYAVVRTDDAKQAYEISNALIEGGIKIIEIPLGSLELLDVIKELSQKEDVHISAGGIITIKQANLAFKNGAHMLVSPVYQKNIVKLSEEFNIPVMMTVSTANEAYQSWKARVPISKLYPAAHMGGVDYVSDLLRPMPFLNLMPTGSIKIEEIPDYLKTGALAVGIGSDLYKGLEKDEIVQKAKKAVELIKNI